MVDQRSKADLRRLVQEALFARNMRGTNCMRVNAAAMELIGLGSDVLPVIEEEIRKSVVPTIIANTSTSNLSQTFLGLDDLWFTYLSIASRNHVQYAVDFLTSLPSPLTLSALIASQTVFRRIPKQASDLEIPPVLREFFRFVANRVPDDMRLFALRLLESFYKS